AGGGVARFKSDTGMADGYLIAPSAPSGTESYWGIVIDSGVLYLSNTTTGTLRKYDATTSAPLGDVVIGGGAFAIIAMPIPESATPVVLCGAMFFLLINKRSSRRG